MSQPCRVADPSQVGRPLKSSVCQTCRVMRTSGICALVVVASLLLPAVATPLQGNAAATRAYVRARYTLAQAVTKNFALSRRAVKNYVNQVVGECPNVLAGAPGGEQSLHFFQEEIYALGNAFGRPDTSVIQAYARAVRGLRWTGRKLNRLVHGDHLRETPNLCADLKAWAASGYRILPKSTKRLVRQIEAPSKGPGSKAIWRLLAPYESPSVKRLVRRTKDLDAKGTDMELKILLVGSAELTKRLGMKTVEATPSAGHTVRGHDHTH